MYIHTLHTQIHWKAHTHEYIRSGRITETFSWSTLKRSLINFSAIICSTRVPTNPDAVALCRTTLNSSQQEFTIRSIRCGANLIPTTSDAHIYTTTFTSTRAYSFTLLPSSFPNTTSTAPIESYQWKVEKEKQLRSWL